LFPTPSFTRFYDHLKQLSPDDAEREYLRAINLLHYTTLSEIGAGMEIVLEANSQAPFEHLKDLVLAGGHRPEPPGCNISSLDQIPLRPELSMYDSLIPQLLETGT